MKPVAKKATAAELRANFAHYYCSVHASHGCTQPCDWLAELDVLLAAARAEAVAPVMDVLRQLVAASVRCGACNEVAACKFVGDGPTRVFRCDSCARFTGGTKDLSSAAPLRLALKLLGVEP